MSRFDPHEDACSRGIDAGAYVLSALDSAEAASFATHLEACDHCRLEVSELQLVVDTLPIAAPQAAPPLALKSRIMAVVEREAELLRAAGPESDRPVPAGPGWRERLKARVTSPVRPAYAGALACTLLVLGLVGGLAIHVSDGGPETRTLRAWAQGPATAQLEQAGDKASLVLAGMPSLQRGKVYQVWFDRGDGQFRPTRTLFNVRAEGGRTTVAIAESVKGIDRIAVTEERSGGALAPSGAPVITASPS